MKASNGWHRESLRHSQARRLGKANPSNRLQYIKSPSNLGEANTLPIQVSMIVPSTKDHNRKITNDEFNRRINETKKEFDKNFGGDTSVTTVGSYYDGEKDQLIKERGVRIESSMSQEKYEKNINDIVKYVRAKKDDWGQDTMALQVEGRLFIIPKKDYIDTDKKIEGKDILVN